MQQKFIKILKTKNVILNWKFRAFTLNELFDIFELSECNKGFVYQSLCPYYRVLWSKIRTPLE